MTFANRNARTGEGMILPPYAHLVEQGEWRVTSTNELELSEQLERRSVLIVHSDQTQAVRISIQGRSRVLGVIMYILKSRNIRFEFVNCQSRRRRHTGRT